MQMTKAQKARAGNVAGRIFKKAQATFGTAADDVTVGPVFDGVALDEEFGQTMTVASGDMVFRLTLSAKRMGASI